jgi:NTE family protein
MQEPPTPHVLEGVEIFEELGTAERVGLARELSIVSLRRGEILVRQHEIADALYVVVTGRFAVSIDGSQAPIAELGPGQPVGEIAFLAGGVRTATVTALRDSLVLRLGRAEFEELSSKSPSIWRALTIALARRVAKANVREPVPPDPRPRTVTLIRAGGSALPAGFVAKLFATFRRSSATMLLDAQGTESVLPSGTRLDNAAATRALNALEASFAYVLYVADGELTPWSEKAIRQADLLLAIGHHDAATERNALERRAAELLRPDAQRLVLLHATRSPITGTATWLKPRRVAMHHHVALDEPGDIERLYRFVHGSALGLVACGGGAYCAAHIGLYKALLQYGLTFDIMGGVSGGSAMAAAFAMGAAPEDVDRATHEIFVTNKAMRRYTLPRYSLLDHTYFDRQLAKYYAGEIEDLWIPYFAISTDLSRHDLHRHRSGELWAAVRASASVPVLLPPFYTADGHMLVDGAIMNNVPVRIMHELKSGPNVVISFDAPRLERFDVDYESLPGRSQLIKSLLNPLLRRGLPVAPGVGTVLIRSLMANRQDFDRDLRPDDLLLIPPIPSDMGVLDWHRHSELAEADFGWALEELGRIRSQGHPVFASTRRVPSLP